MKVITYGVIDWATLEIEHEESYEYEGPVAHCGMILGAALAGGGEGAEKSVEASLKQMHEEALTRLTNWYADQRQQTGIAAQQAQQERGFGETEKMQKIEHDQAVAAAQATREFQTEQEKYKQGEATGRSQITAKSRTDVAEIRAGAQRDAAANKPGPKEWTPQVHTYNAMVPDMTKPAGADGKRPLTMGQKSTTTLAHRSGLQLAQLGDGRFVPFSGDIANIPDASSVGRAPVEKEQLLLQNPTKAGDFLAKYHYLPQEWWQAQTFHDQNVANGGPGLQGPVRNQQSGPTFIDKYNAERNGMQPGTLGATQQGGALSKARAANGAPSSGGNDNEVETENAADDARADAEDEAQDRADNPDDYAPAREPG